MWQFPSEYEPNLDQRIIRDVFHKHGLNIGRMIGSSKSTYRFENPNHEIYFNANIITINYGKVWYGDIDVNVDGEDLKKISKEIEEPLFILYEIDARFENENKPAGELIKLSKCTITPDGEIKSTAT